METCENKGEVALEVHHGACVLTSGDISVAAVLDEDTYACRGVGTGLGVHPCS